MATDLLKDRLKVGQKVKFSPTHQKDITFTGTIVAIHEGAADCVDVKSEAGNGSVSRLYTAHAADVRVRTEKQGKGTNGNKQTTEKNGSAEKPEPAQQTAGEK
jgi:hypothetical protein